MDLQKFTTLLNRYYPDSHNRAMAFYSYAEASGSAANSTPRPNDALTLEDPFEWDLEYPEEIPTPASLSFNSAPHAPLDYCLENLEHRGESQLSGMIEFLEAQPSEADIERHPAIDKAEQFIREVEQRARSLIVDPITQEFATDPRRLLGIAQGIHEGGQPAEALLQQHMSLGSVSILTGFLYKTLRKASILYTDLKERLQTQIEQNRRQARRISSTSTGEVDRLKEKISELETACKDLMDEIHNRHRAQDTIDELRIRDAKEQERRLQDSARVLESLRQENTTLRQEKDRVLAENGRLRTQLREQATQRRSPPTRWRFRRVEPPYRSLLNRRSPSPDPLNLR